MNPWIIEDRSILEFAVNPLGKWSINSVWQKYSSKDVFKLNEITQVLNTVYEQNENQIFLSV